MPGTGDHVLDSTSTQLFTKYLALRNILVGNIFLCVSSSIMPPIKLEKSGSGGAAVAGGGSTVGTAALLLQ